jgi:hypothetical protein
MHHTITPIVAGQLQSDLQRELVKASLLLVPFPRTTRRS